jgi:hypothetical protein
MAKELVGWERDRVMHAPPHGFEPLDAGRHTRIAIFSPIILVFLNEQQNEEHCATSVPTPGTSLNYFPQNYFPLKKSASRRTPDLKVSCQDGGCELYAECEVVVVFRAQSLYLWSISLAILIRLWLKTP